ncbi:alpha/beta fold hydrolase [Tepidicaulis sp.]|uniref:alpha/beta fold hydrolase n=1 Tax=Tepidicaulis sp. TaxID=1920809 RepID=UPI003B58F78A
MRLTAGRGGYWAAGVLAGLVLFFWVLTLLFPQGTARLLVAGLRASAGLEAKVAETAFGPVHYLEGGEGPTVVLLHGIYARKEHWIDFSRALDGYRVVIPDLPGFGENTVLGDGAYDYDRQAARLMAALDELAPGPFHLAGSSMGGQLTGMLAHRFPSRVRSIAFIGSAAGVTSPVASDMERALARGERPLVVTSEAGFASRMDWLFPDAPYIPGPVFNDWAKSEAALANDNERIWEEVGASKAERLEALAPKLVQPALIVWCREDRVFHITGAQALSDLLPNDTLVELNGCGHVPMLDRPSDTGQAYRTFLEELDVPRS